MNCDTGTTCVKKIGDKAEVTWQVQVAPLVQAEDHIQTSKGAEIMVPATVDVTSIRLTHMPTRLEPGDESKGEDPDKRYGKDIQGNTVGGALEDDGEFIAELKFAPVQEVDYEVPIKDSSELDLSNVERDATYGVTPFYKFTAEESEKLNQPRGVEPSSFADQPEWNFYQISLGMNAGVYTFEVTGTVEAVGEDTYVPIRVDNLMWKCSSEDVFGSAEEGCQSLKDYEWGRTGELPPVMTKEQSEYTHEEIVELYENQGSKHGVTGVGTCEVTLNTDRLDTISVDLYPDYFSSRYRKYSETFNLRLNPAVNYYGSQLGREDNCDQGFQHITLCPDEETEVPPSKEPVESEEPTPSEEPQESEEPTPSEEEEVEPAKPSKETEEPTSSEEPQESEQVKPVKPAEYPEEREEPKIPVVPPTLPDTDTEVEQGEVVTTVVEPEDKEEPAESKPESKPEPKTVISESVKDNVAKQAKTVAKKDRPKVTTGGHLRAA
ncbi:hypothetical protein EML15_02645 [Corynebacterium sp. sy017]|uniref:hypothetical protein n=1 Tax=unclassified Corynebacterium TaxID=2624378 RepID=UPI0011864774|nr:MULTISPECIES: hypothetical protein [unclassified Corynebacterium]MBP3088053.1 hypothetical protein [Corynebacterium sp. sy017]TSD92581.1 hypothetical protein ELY17_02645 [Corynebacterium sp. SY003]